MKSKYIFLFILSFYLIKFSFALTGAKYLIITPDSYVSEVQPLADWKTKKGVKAKVVPLSVTGSSASQIKTYITNAYNNWDIRPQYILLAGSGSLIPSWSIGSGGYSDDSYADITGNYRIELSIGRFPCSSVSQMQNIVAKTLAFERTPFMGDSTWFIKGTTIVREDNVPAYDAVYWENVRYIHGHWRNYQYFQIDSFSSQRGHSNSDVNNSINNGRIFVAFRGQSVTNWWSPFAMTPDNLSNGNKLPIIVSGTCVTMSPVSSGYLGDQFINAGSISNPKGAVGFFGTTVSASGSGLATHRGTVAKGFFQAIFGERTWAMGDAAKRGKFLVDSAFGIQVRYQEWELFGDPELQLWTGIPQRLIVTHDTAIATQPQTFNITAMRGTLPCNGALVCIMMDSTIYQTASTNSNGIASFTINPPRTGTMSVTVTAHNCIPYERDVTIRPGNLDHDVGIQAIVEPQGAIPTNTNVIPKVRVKNYGTSTETFPITFKIGTLYEQTVLSVSLNAGDSTTVLFPSWIAVTGNHTIVTYTALNIDQWRGNDTAYGSVNVVAPNDVGVDEIISPDSVAVINSQLIPIARIKNYGPVAQTNFTATCSIVGANGVLRYTNTQTITSLASGDTIRVNFSGWTPIIAERCTVKIRTNLAGDENPNNDRMIKIVRISMLFLAEGFNGSFPPSGWQDIAVQGTYVWEGTSANDNPPCTPYEGSAMVSYPSFSAPSGNMARLISPPILLGATPVICSLKFYMYHDDGYPGGTYGPDSVKVEYSTNGTTFYRRAAFRRYEPVNDWQGHSVYLGTLSGTIYFSFLAFSEYGDNMNIDYVRLMSPSSITEEDMKSTTLSLLTILRASKPNPITHSYAQISFTVSEPMSIALKIYDVSGKLVKTLANAQLESGNYNYTWNGRDELNRTVAKGIYFYTLETPKQNLTKKIIFIK
jgi:hypothetical protein